MSSGTIKLTNGSTAVAGTSTTFTTDLKPGDVISTTTGGVPYTLFVDTVTSNTALTLSDAFTGPTTSGAAYVAVPAQTLSRLPAQLATQTSEAVRRVLQDNANWQSFYSGTGDISVTVPDGSLAGKQIGGPSWAKLSGIANTSWTDRGQLAADANLNTMAPNLTEGEWSKSSSTGLTIANNFPPGAGVGILKVMNGGRYQGTQIYTDYKGNNWLRTLTSTWNGTNGPWSDWINCATVPMRSTDLAAGFNLNTLNGPDTYGSYRIAGSVGTGSTTAANNVPYDAFSGFVVCQQGYTGSTNSHQIALANGGSMFSRYVSGTWNGTDGPWSAWVEIGCSSRIIFETGDLNNIVMSGIYPLSYVAASALNWPVPVGGIMRVTARQNNLTTVVQEFIPVVGGGTYAGRKFFRTLAGGIWTSWSEDGVYPLQAWGIGATAVKSSFDWQNDDLIPGSMFGVVGSAITNTPSQISINTATGYNFRVVGGSGSGSTTNRMVEISPQTTSDAVYQRFEVRVVGVAGSRTFNVRQLWTSADTLPIANGGTGSTTAANARTALGVAYGTVAGTVAQGNDSRLDTVNGKTGGTVSSTINLTGLNSAFVAHQNGAGTEGANTFRRMVYGYTNANQLSWIDAYLTPNNMMTRIVTQNNTTYRTFNFFDNGNGTCDGTWVGGSDIRFKNNIQVVGGALNAVLSWRGVTYVKKDGVAEVGLIAQDVEKDCPQAVINGGRREYTDGTVIEDFKMLNTAGVAAAYHTEAIKALFGLVKLAIDDPAAARTAIAAIENASQVTTSPGDSPQSHDPDDVESETPETQK